DGPDSGSTHAIFGWPCTLVSAGGSGSACATGGGNFAPTGAVGSPPSISELRAAASGASAAARAGASASTLLPAVVRPPTGSAAARGGGPWPCPYQVRVV